MGSLGCEDGWSLCILVLCETFMFIVRDFQFKKIQVYTVMKHRSIIEAQIYNTAVCVRVFFSQICFL